MTEPAPSRDALSAILAGLLYLLLLATLRDVLSPPVVLPLLLVALWPLRARPGVQAAMGIAVALTVVWGLKLYGGLLGPFLLALAVAYLLSPLVARLERRGVGRGVAILLVTLPPLGALVAILALAGPQLWTQAVAVVNAMPRFAGTILDLLTTLRNRLEGLAFLTPGQRDWIHDLNAEQLSLLLQQNADGLLQRLAEWGLAVLRQLGTVVGFVGYLVVTPVVAFYLLRDWGRLLGFLEEAWAETERQQIDRDFLVADTYDAIVSDRPYRKGGTDEKARQEITNAAGTNTSAAAVVLVTIPPQSAVQPLNAIVTAGYATGAGLGAAVGYRVP